MAAIFPPIPRFVFTIFEPISLVAGFITPLVSPTSFIAEQLPSHPLTISPTAHLLALQLGNVYLLIGIVGLFLLYTSGVPAKLAHRYIWALWVGDIGHLGVMWWFMGTEQFLGVRDWNSMAMGNVGATFFLFVTRSLYLMGALGSDRVPAGKVKAK